MKFQPGKSGNPAGKPKGVKDKRTELRELLRPHAEKLVKKVVMLALKGDTTALRICLDRILSPMKARDSCVDIAPLTGTLSEQGEIVLRALSDGSVSPHEAANLMQAVAAQAKLVEVDSLAARVLAIEQRQLEGR